MATKFGEGYYEIYPRINQAAVKVARDAIAKGLGDEFARTQARMRNEDERTTRERINNENRTRRVYKKNSNDTIRDENVVGRIRAAWNKRLNEDTKKNEGAFHKLATQFRTIGTIVRGLGVASAVLGGFNTLRIALGGIATALPAINAGLVATPSLLASVGAEALILKIAFHGVGTTIKDAFDPKKAKQYQQELKKLAPAARTFVQEIAKLKDLKLPNLQQAFFSQGAVQKTAKNLPKLVQGLAPGAAKVSAASGGLLGGIGSSLTGNKGLAAFNQVLRSLALTLKAVTPGFKKFTDGLLELIGHVSALGTGKLGKSFSDWLTKVGKFLSQIDVAKVFAKGKDSLHAFLGLASDVWDILKKIFQALNTKNAFGSFIAIIHEIRQFVDSGAGQVFLGQLSSALSTLSSLSSSLTGSALKLLAGAFAAFYPAIKPLADVIAKIGRDLVPLGPVIGQVASQFFQLGTWLLNILEPVIKRVVNFMSDHTGTVKVFAGAIAALYLAFKTMGAVVSIAEKATKAWVIVQKAAKIATAAWTVVQWLFNAAMDANPVVLITLAIIALIAIIVVIATKTDWFQRIWKASWTFIKKIALDVWHFLVNDVFNPMKNFFTKTIPSWVLKLRDWFVYAWNWIARKTHQTWSSIINFFTGTVKNFFVKTVPSWFLKLRDWVVYAYNAIVSKTHAIWSGIINFFTGRVKGFFTKTIPDWVRKLRDWFVYFFNRIRDAVANFIENNVIKKFNKLKDFFTKTVPGWAGTLKKAVLDTFTKMWQGIASIWVKVYNSVRDVVQTIVDHVWNSGLAKGWNAVAGFLHLGVMKLPKISIPRWNQLAEGGPIRGPGGPKSDQIPIWASNGEFMVNAEATRKHYGLLHAINSGKELRGGFASGGAVSAIEALQRAVGPALGVTSTTGGNHAKNSYHYRGMAVDFSSGSQRAMDAAAANLMKFSGYILELIHSPNWFVKNYHKTGKGTYASVYGAHFNHVHLAMTAANAVKALKDFRAGKITGGFVGGGPGGAAAVDPRIAKLHRDGALKQFAAAYASLKGIPQTQGPHGNPLYAAYAKKPIDSAVSTVNSTVQSIIDAANAAASSLGGAATNLSLGKGKSLQWIEAASHYSNIPKNWVNMLQYIMGRESGFNPRAINRTDINAKLGIPSQGLMQLIPPNFKHYHAKGTSNNILDPVANIAAAVNYIHARYGTIFNTPWAKHTGTYYAKGGLVPTLFDSGGYLPPKSMTLAANNTSNWERVGGGLPSKIVLDLGDNKTIEFMMDDRIAKYEDEIIKYSATR